eukprot:scaffold4097_cov306-Pinguiococcus_pyrenoidosus.AAC.15
MSRASRSGQPEAPKKLASQTDAEHGCSGGRLTRCAPFVYFHILLNVAEENDGLWILLSKGRISFVSHGQSAALRSDGLLQTPLKVCILGQLVRQGYQQALSLRLAHPLVDVPSDLDFATHHAEVQLASLLLGRTPQVRVERRGCRAFFRRLCNFPLHGKVERPTIKVTDAPQRVRF